MRIEQFVIDGLGHLSALVWDDASGAAAVVDPRRDVDVYLAAARARDLRITHVVETHLHNDYVSGGRELAALTGATHVIGAGADLRYAYQPLRGGESFDVGALRFEAADTPGHTPEHVVYAVADRTRSDEPFLLLTGGSLLVGAVGRTDLLGEALAATLTPTMHRSLHEVILRHEDSVLVYPTHGAGSLCSTGISSTPSSTVGYERRNQPLLQPMEVDAFAHRLLADQPTFPAYFARMRPMNQSGPALTGGSAPTIPPLDVEAFRRAMDAGALVVDARPAASHAIAHIPGSISIPAGTSFGTWLGWVVPHDRPTLLVIDGPDDADDVSRQIHRIGHDAPVGSLHGGFGRWIDAGLPTESRDGLTSDDLAQLLAADPAEAPLVLDVRQAAEYRDGHVPGAWSLSAGSLPEHLATLPRERHIAVMCASGYRSSLAASLLGAAGFERVSWLADGVPAWQAAGYPVAVGDGPEPLDDTDTAAVPELADHRH
jgi:hydroxyacylglutathione hydrolase